MSLFLELRRRNVLKVAAAYALVAWILIEAGSVLLPTFGAPEWFFQVYVIVVISGWVVALIIAWIFEITPEGVRLERDIDRSTYQPQSRGRLNGLIITLLVMALGVSVSFNVLGLRDTAPEANPGQTYHSVAVLPFENRSAEPESRFFTDGVHDDLLTRLSNIESLRVISRTSVMKYRSGEKNIRLIGAELGVATIVEGSVQQYGDQVRVNVQLIDAQTDEHIWANTYDRSLTIENVFEIQSDISGAIAASLQQALTPAERQRLNAVPTVSLEAYSRYTAGRRNLYQREFETTVEARQLFEQAIENDPQYADAYAGLAEAVILLLINHKAVTPDDAFRIASAATARALELDPELARAHALEGLIESERWQMTRLGEGNQKAAASFHRAIEINPNIADAYVWFASLRESEARFDEAIDNLRVALEIDPLGRIPYVNLPSLYAAKGENGPAIELLLQAMTIFPEWDMPYGYLTEHLQRMGRLDESIAWSKRLREVSEDPLAGGNVLPIYQALGYHEAIEEFGESFPSDHPLYPIGVAYMHFLNGEFAPALATLEPVFNETATPFRMVYPFLVRSAMQGGEYDKAYEYLVRSSPAVVADATLTIDRVSIGAVIMLAFLEQKRGNHGKADRLLERAGEEIQRMPRSGIWGHGIKDVQILALQGRPEAALAALREAIDDGFVSLIPFEYWSIDQDPLLDSLRIDPRFESMRNELEERMEVLRRSVEYAHKTGDWQSLRDRASTI
jgi:TolB-like protein/Tfp pilus assembly protein PilF